MSGRTKSAGARILVVDDDENSRAILRYRLEARGYVVLEAAGGHEALGYFRDAVPPDLVLLDIMMPEIDGFEVCRRIRESSPEVPVIFITALTRSEERQESLRLGAAGFLTKPFAFHEVEALVQRALEPRP
jgi:two-component system, sensor histidine kinase ChiS